MYLGVDDQNVTIVTDPAGTPVDGQPNTYDYPILTNVTLMCVAATVDGSPVTYYWNDMNYDSTGDSDNACFYGSHTGQNLTINDLLAEDAGTVICIATIGGTNYTSNPLTLHISG